MLKCQVQFIHGFCVARRPVDLQRRARALLGQRVERSGGHLTVIRGHWTPLAGPRVTDVVRRLRIAVVAPDMFMEV